MGYNRFFIPSSARAVESTAMGANGKKQADPRFSRLENLDETLQDAFVAGRINLPAANTLVGLSPGTQRRVARWLDQNPDRRIGSRHARRLIKAQLEGVRLDRNGIEHVLERPHAKDDDREYVHIPMSSLPQGLTRRQAQAWVERAIKAYRED